MALRLLLDRPTSLKVVRVLTLEVVGITKVGEILKGVVKRHHEVFFIGERLLDDQLIQNDRELAEKVKLLLEVWAQIVQNCLHINLVNL